MRSRRRISRIRSRWSKRRTSGATARVFIGVLRRGLKPRPFKTGCGPAGPSAALQRCATQNQMRPQVSPKAVVRCEWARSELMIRYHDEEWGVPVHDDRRLFEFLILEGAQAGLSWETILNKRENYRAAFDGFDAELVAGYNKRKIAQLLRNEGIVRNRLKVASAVRNAQA